MSESASARPASSRPPAARLAALVAVALAIAAGALGLARALDQPVGAGDADAARPVAGDVTVDGVGLTPSGALPPLALIVGQPLPAEIRDLPPRDQALALQRSASSDGRSPGPLVQLGALLQGLGANTEAEEAYRLALRRDPDNTPALVGLAMVDGARGPAGQARAARLLQRLARERPDSQLVAFNQGWLAVYREDAAVARSAWTRTVALGAGTPLGRTATQLLAAVERGRSSAAP